MKTEILVNVRPEAVRVAVTEDGRLVEYKLEKEDKIAGNIYLGRVDDVVPGMSCAFVDIGIGKNAFLARDDVITNGSGRANAQPSGRSGRGRSEPIESLLSRRQTIMVQAQKGPVGEKGARITMRIALPGRLAVLLPTEKGKSGISRKIRDFKERTRLKEIARKSITPEFGLIIRTEAEGQPDEVIAQEISSLLDVWQSITKKQRFRRKCLLWEQPPLLERMIRDLLRAEVNRLLIDDRKQCAAARRVVRQTAPHLVNKVRLYREKEPMFEAYKVEEQVQQALRPTVPLPSGGSLTIEETEACTTVDVNTGKFVGDTDIEDTAFKTNIEASDEIARQLRLRDIGGIIIIDFIDMEVRTHQKKLVEALEADLRRDPTRTRIWPLSSLGLVEMTRKRSGESLLHSISEPCPTCQGTGHILPETV